MFVLAAKLLNCNPTHSLKPKTPRVVGIAPGGWDCLDPIPPLDLLVLLAFRSVGSLPAGTTLAWVPRWPTGETSAAFPLENFPLKTQEGFRCFCFFRLGGVMLYFGTKLSWLSLGMYCGGWVQIALRPKESMQSIASSLHWLALVAHGSCCDFHTEVFYRKSRLQAVPTRSLSSASS